MVLQFCRGGAEVGQKFIGEYAFEFFCRVEAALLEAAPQGGSESAAGDGAEFAGLYSCGIHFQRGAHR